MRHGLSSELLKALWKFGFNHIGIIERNFLDLAPSRDFGLLCNSFGVLRKPRVNVGLGRKRHEVCSELFLHVSECRVKRNNIGIAHRIRSDDMPVYFTSRRVHDPRATIASIEY